MNRIYPALAEANSFRAFIQVLRICPSMYIGIHRLDYFYHFMAGWEYAKPFIEDKQQMDKLKIWIVNKMGDKTAYGWKDVILKEQKGDQAKALDRFFALYDEYVLREATHATHIDLNERLKLNDIAINILPN